MEDLKQLQEAISLVTTNLFEIGFGAVSTGIGIVTAWIKLHKKIIGDPLKLLDKRINGLTRTEAVNNTSQENRIKEVDQLLQIHDSRLEELEKEDSTLISTIQINKSQLERLQTNFEHHKEQFQELKSTISELRELDTQRQVAIGKVQTFLEVLVGKN